MSVGAEASAQGRFNEAGLFRFLSAHSQDWLDRPFPLRMSLTPLAGAAAPGEGQRVLLSTQLSTLTSQLFSA